MLVYLILNKDDNQKTAVGHIDVIPMTIWRGFSGLINHSQPLKSDRVRCQRTKIASYEQQLNLLFASLNTFLLKDILMKC